MTSLLMVMVKGWTDSFSLRPFVPNEVSERAACPRLDLSEQFKKTHSEVVVFAPHNERSLFASCQ